MRARGLHFWGSAIFLVTIAGACDQPSAPREQRTPRVVEATPEVFDLDDIDATKDLHVTRELVPDWIENARPPVRPPARPRLADLPSAAVEQVPLEAELDKPVEIVPPVPPPAPPPPHPLPQARSEANAFAPPPRGAHETAIQWTVAIGAAAIGVGSAAATTADGRTGDQTFAAGALGLGIVSLSTALVLHWTEPAPKPGVNVTMAPGMLGVRGTF